MDQPTLDLDSTNRLHELAMRRMERRVILAFRLNRVTHMSMAELQCCTRADWQKGENLTLADTVKDMEARGRVKMGAYGTDCCRVPSIILQPTASIPHTDSARAYRMLTNADRKLIEAGQRNPRVRIPKQMIETA